MLQAAQDGCTDCVEKYVRNGGSVVNSDRLLTVWSGSCHHSMWNAWKATFEGGVARNRRGQEAVRRYLSGLVDAERHIAETEAYWSKKGDSNQEICCTKWYSNKDSSGKEQLDEEVPMSGVWQEPSTESGMSSSRAAVVSTSGRGSIDGHSGSRSPSGRRVSEGNRMRQEGGGMLREDEEIKKLWRHADKSIQEFHQLCRLGEAERIKDAIGSDARWTHWWLFTTSEVQPGMRIRASEYAWIGMTERGELDSAAFRMLELMERTVLMQATLRE